MTEPIIRMSSVSTHFGSKRVLDQLQWQVYPLAPATIRL
jgi:ABC-type molybdenum transport system ATPase subunit/photorepair protein PhrA